ncbi:MAG: hypothetical protein IPK68_09380 [Bdellovibrionales bacterium]|nr:hypothetical protein [Bdellovibrionales bacterium]
MMNENAILYLTSSAAQVWAAVMVFVVLLLRDKSDAVRKQQLEIQTESIKFIRPLVKVLEDPNKPHHTQLAKFELDSSILNTFDVHLKSFSKLAESIRKHGIIHVINNAIHLPQYDINLSAAKWQEKLNSISDKYAELTYPAASGNIAFFIGIGGVMVNLFGIAYSTTKQANPEAVVCMIWLFLGINALISIIFSIFVLKALPTKN